VADAERFSQTSAKSNLVGVFKEAGGLDDRGLRDPWLTQDPAMSQSCDRTENDVRRILSMQ
jgi:hypothetical protein